MSTFISYHEYEKKVKTVNIFDKKNNYKRTPFDKIDKYIERSENKQSNFNTNKKQYIKKRDQKNFKRKGNFSSISGLLDEALSRTGVKKLTNTTLVLDKFDSLCSRKWGGKIKGEIKALYVKNKILTVACLNSVLAQEIQLHAHLFIREIDKEYKGAVERIRFVL